jgi:hypothetical protein
MIKAREDLQQITMVEGDYGVALDIDFEIKDDITQELNHFNFYIFKEPKKDPIITKNSNGNNLKVILTKEESAKLPPGRYIFEIEWEEETLENNIIANGDFIVTAKSGKVDEVSDNENDENTIQD